jgi:SAM-dependent methyltransferase
MQEIEFINGFVIDSEYNLVNTNFFVDHSEVPKKIKYIYKNRWKLGGLLSGHEWLAFTFKNQDLENFNRRDFMRLISYSERKVKEAYSRMKLPEQAWANHTEHEVNYIIENLKINGNEEIADFGCGIGRHTIEFAKRGFNIIGIDFSKSQIDKAKDLIQKNDLSNVKFIEGDCRNIKLNRVFDLIICLYDVIGSFPTEKDNDNILKNIYKHLKKGGYAVISVMNMELTDKIAKYRADINKDPKVLLNLKPSNIMQSSGNIFNPDYFIIDTNSMLVYRKEQFENDTLLSSEYVIRDKRYTKDEICDKLKGIGFDILDSYYVQAGKWCVHLKNTALNAKEILIFANKSK